MPVDPSRDHIQGPEDAPVTLVEYGDYECSYCGQAFKIVQSVQAQMGDQLRFVFRNFPLSEIHPHAAHAALAAEIAATEGKFWEMHDALYTHQRNLADRHLAEIANQIGLDGDDLLSKITAGQTDERVQEDFMSGIRSGVNGTPTFFINGQRYDGSWDEESLLAAVGG
jgi:protein-disulfide isomerase